MPLIIFSVDFFITMGGLFFATRMAYFNCTYVQMVIIALLVSTSALLPMYGWGISFIVFTYLLLKFTEEHYSRCLWIVSIIRSISFFSGILVLATTS